MLSSYTENKLIDAILHCLWGAGLLAGLQNPADPPWELWITPILQKAEQTMGILFQVNKILKYNVEIPSIAGQSEGQDLGAYSSVLLLQKRMAHTSHCAALSWGYSAPSREKGLVPCAESVPTPACQGTRLPWVTLSWTAGTPSAGHCWPQHPLSAEAHVHGGHAWQGPLCSGDNAPSSTGQHSKCPNSAGTNSWGKEGRRWENNSPPGERSSACRHLKALPDYPALCTQGLLLTLPMATKLLRLKPQKFWKKCMFSDVLKRQLGICFNGKQLHSSVIWYFLNFGEGGSFLNFQ